LSGKRQAVLLYDADCGFCTWSTAKVLAWDRRRRLRPLALQDPEAERLLAGMREDERMASWHLVLEDGSVLSAGAAAPHLLRLLPGGRPLAWLTATFPRATELVYRAISARRGSPGRLISERARERARGRIMEREGLTPT
jgi:predicted DCC family thiol-disulfide oxidoreductase YuxK